MSAAPNLSERVVVQRRTQTPDLFGGYTEDWTSISSLNAEVRPLSGTERDMAAQTEAPRDYRFTFRRSSATASLTNTDRLVWRGQTFNIRFIADKGPRALYIMVDGESGVAT